MQCILSLLLLVEQFSDEWCRDCRQVVVQLLLSILHSNADATGATAQSTTTVAATSATNAIVDVVDVPSAAASFATTNCANGRLCFVMQQMLRHFTLLMLRMVEGTLVACIAIPGAVVVSTCLCLVRCSAAAMTQVLAVLTARNVRELLEKIEWS